jgi:hypothetical protein
MVRVASRRAGIRRWSRSGLPFGCGVKLPNGEECRVRTLGPCSRYSDPDQCPRVPICLTPDRVPYYYRTWLRENGREQVLPDNPRVFLRWWDHLQWLDEERPPML